MQIYENRNGIMFYFSLVILYIKLKIHD